MYFGQVREAQTLLPDPDRFLVYFIEEKLKFLYSSKNAFDLLTIVTVFEFANFLGQFTWFGTTVFSQLFLPVGNSGHWALIFLPRVFLR
jgi:hypothetical protein